MVTKDVIDLIVEAAKNKELMDQFKKAKSAEDLQKRLQKVKPGYFVRKEDCGKLLKGRKKILSAMSKWEDESIY